ncbi:hypothetical protein [Bartonella grahamii]|uniref:hypothetical protein n=1 Tax=Bartonella grahamii TaxID=33045 RepID=UPI002E7C4748|nr:hypothetical protein [Bartonella grahamii]
MGGEVGMERGWCVTGGESVYGLKGRGGFDGGDIGWVRRRGIVYRSGVGWKFCLLGDFWDCSVVGLEVTFGCVL